MKGSFKVIKNRNKGQFHGKGDFGKVRVSARYNGNERKHGIRNDVCQVLPVCDKGVHKDDLKSGENSFDCL